MGYPTPQKTWIISPNNTITFVSLVDTMGNYLKGIADFLTSNGYTCKGSSNGTTGAMDGTNRWSSSGAASTRAANTTTANSWIVLTDGNGCDLCLSYVGGTDDVARFSFSPGGLFVAAGTATFTPTATDELVVLSTASLIGNTASADRIWNGWVDSQAKLCRFIVFRSGAIIGAVWGLELINHLTTSNWLGPKVWGFGFSANSFTTTNAFGNSFPSQFASNSNGGLAKTTQVMRVGGGIFTALGATATSTWGDTLTALQGGASYPIFGPLSVAASTDGSGSGINGGIMGYLFDWWTARANGAPGVTYNSLALIGFGSGAIMWPWDGATAPVNGGAAPGTLNGYWHINNPLDVPYAVPTAGYDDFRPLAWNAVTPTGPTAVKSVARRPGVDVIRLRSVSTDPPAEAGKFLIYTRLIGGQQALFGRRADGTVTMIGAG